MKGKLILEDGSVYTGELLDSETRTVGEVVFTTTMTGYQESLTDPSFCGQILTMTYPLIGNYGSAEKFMQSRRSFVRGFVIGELCDAPNNWQAEESLTEFLRENNIPCLYHVDTRAVTRHIRSAGAMKGVIVPENMSESEIAALQGEELPRNVVEIVTTPEVYTLETETPNAPHIVAMDFGVKRSILQNINRIGAKVTVVPAHTSAEEVLALNPDGIFLSNGPGDPTDVPKIVEEVRKLAGKKPIFGICLGHQLLALAFGAKTYKMKFGHRGGNQPVKNLKMGKVHISAQNHGYAVDPASLAGTPLVVTHTNVNDDTIEGLRHTELPIFSVQYHPEAAPGPDDNMYLFDEFWDLMKGE
ncbi:glutamine-hydrolyzing carbamoyl-phosphate synthase small subunit [Selenomonas timonae]|uniref:Carbamoyl phosphate synthase small chain n=1 Tax=Selenomonas timonae TaxID=2754044 RepID=A0A7G7VIH8_9FIRM|nr:glutamine-hydrolyzing carbamoyl-phosphate synthase small subunit [Selenomonas timonae]QNH53921.1 glutamine-hydrolyzing carbamoyl-phosphate synthase small subunit [Selenomonas timonae]